MEQYLNGGRWTLVNAFLKKGKQNNRRADDPAFIHALLLVETPCRRPRMNAFCTCSASGRNALLSAAIACGSSIAVEMSSSKLMSSKSKAVCIWVQPARKRSATRVVNARSNRAATVSGALVT